MKTKATMKVGRIVSHNKNPDIDTSKVKFVGILDANYNDLVKVFGEPLEGDLYKIDAKWILNWVKDKRKFSAVVYNFKTGKNYLGKDGIDVKKNPNWNVSSSNTIIDAPKIIEDYLKEKVKN